MLLIIGMKSKIVEVKSVYRRLGGVLRGDLLFLRRDVWEYSLNIWCILFLDILMLKNSILGLKKFWN